MADQLVPDTPQVYYRAVSTDGWPVTITLSSKLPIDQLGSPNQLARHAKSLRCRSPGSSPVNRSSQPRRIHRTTLSTWSYPLLHRTRPRLLARVRRQLGRSWYLGFRTPLKPKALVVLFLFRSGSNLRGFDITPVPRGTQRDLLGSALT